MTRTGGKISRRWVLLAGAALLGTVGVAAAIASLPRAPVVSPIAAPDSPAGPLAHQIESLTFASPTIAWAVVPTFPYWRLVRTIDAGRTWRDVTPLGAGTNGGIEATILSPTTSILAYRAYEYNRDSAFALTVNGGADWTTGILPNAVGQGPDPMAFIPPRSVWAVLGSGLLAVSSDFGATWSSLTLPTPPTGSCQPTSVRFINAEVGWISGTCQGSVALWQTTTGGLSWSVVVLEKSVPGLQRELVSLPQGSSAANNFTTVVSVERHQDQVVEFRLQDGSWSATTPESVPGGQLLVYFANPSAGWILDAASGKGALALLYQTADGGADWALRATPIPAGSLTALDVLGGEVGAALAQQGRAARLWTTQDGGLKWSSSSLQIASGPPPRSNGVAG